ncbi:MAG: DUF2218 domain-containing protein [Paracoccus sp. (in: a-proteobacteria)]|uniref:DUF2218 domain-containing protein n=1 Tax=Paracoccus sp. TaxID=267 RepID=UPI00391DBFF4
MKITASFPTQRGPALMGTMAKHFGHKIPVISSDTSALFDFQDGTATLAVTATGLALDIEAPTPNLIARLRGVIESHLIRFAHREDPQPLIWTDPA